MNRLNRLIIYGKVLADRESDEVGIPFKERLTIIEDALKTYPHRHQELLGLAEEVRWTMLGGEGMNKKVVKRINHSIHQELRDKFFH